MLKWSFKNQNLLKFYNKSHVELKVKLSKVLILWFINQRQFKIVNVKYNIINNFTRFLKIFIKGVLTFIFKKSTRSTNYPLLQYETTKFINFIISMNYFIIKYISEPFIRFYKHFLQFYWLINTDILKVNTLTKKKLEKQLYYDYNYKNNLPYFYNYIINQNSLSTYSKINIACFMTGRSRAVIRAFKLSRFKFREMANSGFFCGLSKSSW